MDPDRSLGHDILFEASPIPGWIVDSETLQIVAANEAAVALSGGAREMLVGAHALSIHPETAVDALLEDSAPIRCRHPRRGGGELDVEVASRAVTFAGRAARLVVLNEVGEHLRVEAALREREEQYRGILDATFDSIVIHQDDVVRFANPSFAEIAGYPLEELIGQPVMNFVAPDMRTFARLQTGRRTEGHYAYATYNRAGDRLELEVCVKNCIYEGRPARIVAAQDVTAKKRAERALAFLAEATAVLASSLDYDATVTASARLAVPMIGDYAVIDMLQPDGSMKRLAVEHADPAKVAIGWELGRRFPYREGSAYGPSGIVFTGQTTLEIVTEEMYAARLPDPEQARLVRSLGLTAFICVPLRARGRIVGGLVIGSAESGRRFDAADVALAEELGARANSAIENARSFREEQQANSTKDEFLATVSHELRTPLNAILGWTSLLRTERGGDPGALQRGLETIERNARAQARLIDDVLDVSRIIAGKLAIEAEPVELGAVIRAALDALAPAAQAKGVEMRAEIDGPLWVKGDPDRLQQIVGNVASNAVKFTSKQGKVSVSAEIVDDAARVCVEDDGEGISAHMLPSVFERFRQADGSTSRRHGGLGLGLAIARHLAEAHGGSISAASEGAGRGATFTVHLPLGSAPPEGDAATRADARSPRDDATAEAAALGPEPRALEGLRVLVCDDDLDARGLLVALLGARGAEVSAAATAEEAFRAVEALRPHVIVSDIAMAGEDGYELLRRVRQLPPSRGGDTPAIALSALARGEDARRALEAGFQTHASKPFEPRELVATIAELAARRRR